MGCTGYFASWANALAFIADLSSRSGVLSLD